MNRSRLSENTKLNIDPKSIRRIFLVVNGIGPGIADFLVATTMIRTVRKSFPKAHITILTGKVKQASPGKKKTLLLGKCICEANQTNPNIRERIAIKGCPPSPRAILKSLHQAGIEADPDLFENMDRTMGIQMKRYEGKPEFDESFYQVAES